MLLTDTTDVGYPRVYIHKQRLRNIDLQDKQTLARQLEGVGFLALEPGRRKAFCWWLDEATPALGSDADYLQAKPYVAVPYPYLSPAQIQQLKDAYVTH